MNIYLGTIELESMEVVLEQDRNDLYKAPEQQTVYIRIADFGGGSFVFRLGRKDYDVFRQKIIETEGYK